MPDEQPVAKKNDQKMVPLDDFLAFKNASREREKKLKGQLEERDSQISKLQTDLSVSQVDMDDDDAVKSVRAMLKEENKALETSREKYSKDVTSLSERERKVRAMELAAEYGQRGVSIDYETLLEEEDMEKSVLTQYAEFLAEKEKKLVTPSEPKSIFETGPVSPVSAKAISDIDVTTAKGRAELADVEKTLRAKALSR